MSESIARAAAVETAGSPDLVGDHLGAFPESDVGPALGEVRTHTFASRLPGYVGWHWAVTVARVPGEDRVTVDDDSADDPEGRIVAGEIGLGRERVMSREGRSEAVARWTAGEFGPSSPMARQAPGPCATCGFYLPLAGSLRQSLGACGNAYAPGDGRVVTADYGCGAHSQATLVVVEETEVVTSARYDTSEYDVLAD